MRATRKNPAFASWLTVAAMPWATASSRRFCEIRNGGTPTSGTSEFWGGDVMWLTPDDLGRLSNKTIKSSLRTITEEAIENSNAALVPAGSLILSTRAPIGHLAIAGRETAFNQGCRALVPATTRFSSGYLYYYLDACRPVLEAAIAAQILDDEDDSGLTPEAREAMLREMVKRPRQENLSYFAFTATPKFKTKVLFDEPGDDGKSPFHLYSMRQAIQEGFILDVLANISA